MAAQNQLYVLTVALTFMGIRIPKGTMLALTPAQVTLLGAGNLRAANNPVNTNGSQVASQTTTRWVKLSA